MWGDYHNSAISIFQEYLYQLVQYVAKQIEVEENQAAALNMLVDLLVFKLEGDIEKVYPLDLTFINKE